MVYLSGSRLWSSLQLPNKLEISQNWRKVHYPQPSKEKCIREVRIGSINHISCSHWMFGCFGWMLVTPDWLFDMTNGTFAVNNWILYKGFTSLERMFQPDVCMFKSQILVLCVNVERPHWRMGEWIEGWQIEFWRCWNAIFQGAISNALLVISIYLQLSEL